MHNNIILEESNNIILEESYFVQCENSHCGTFVRF